MVKTYAKKITAVFTAVTIIFSMLLYFPSGTFSNISFGLTANAAESTNDVTISGVTGNPKGYTNEEYTNLFDGDTGTKWCCGFGDCAYVIFKASEPIKFSKYSIATANDIADWLERNPVEWTLYGCMNYANENTSWTVIDTVTDGGLPSENEAYADFDLAEITTFYQYFKLEFTKLKGDDCEILQISEIELKDYTTCEHQWEATGETIDPTCTEDGYYVEYCPICQLTRNVPIDALGHDFVGEACTRCGLPYITEPSKDGSGVYQIGTKEELHWFADKVNNDNANYGSASAVLTANIVINTDVLNDSGELNTGTFIDWMLIGNSSNPYSGTFDGQNHTISGLYFNNTSTSNVGLFGYLGSGGEIKNVGVVDSYLYGKAYVGGVCGRNYGGTITGCYNTGTVSSSYNSFNFVGGVCGGNGGTITDCCNAGKIIGVDSVGGVCGDNGGTITGCCNTGTVSCTGYRIGGVCGNNGSTITGCYNTGTVSGSSYVGGVCGRNYYGGRITNCYNTGNVSGTFGYVGSVCGFNTYNSTITNCYYDSDKYSGNAVDYNEGTVTDVEGRPTADFTNCTVCELVGYDQWPDVTASGVFEISNACQLYWFSQHVNGGNTGINAVLTADITANTGVLKSDGTLADDTSGFRSWTPIGNNSYKYTGTFDGQGHTISGLYFNDTDDTTGKYVGLFGSNSGTIKNAGVVDSYFNGYELVGGVCGDNESGTIANCYNTGNVSGSELVGGVCGWSDGTITGCYNTGKVSGDTSVGGVCGRNYTGTITGCYNTGTVSGINLYSQYIGGVCGDNYQGTIKNCYNSGTVICNYDYVGGVCGDNESGTITNCYNTGNVSGSEYVGSVCGSNDSTITNCYFDSGNAVGFNQGKVTDVESKTTAQFASGEVAYLLNGSTSEGTLAWGQTLGKDASPVLDGTKKVYYGYKTCSESEVMSYSNTELSSTRPEHNYSNGICTVCGAYEPAVFNETDNCYEIYNAVQLYWFAGLVNGTLEDVTQNTAANAVLTADIIVNKDVLDDSGELNTGTFIDWAPIGYYKSLFDKVSYSGIFDGQNHTISGLYFNNTSTSTSSAGLFGFLGSGGEIKNVGVVDSYFNGYNYVGGVCGYNDAGTITASYNTGTVSGTGNYVGGVCGYNGIGRTITGCYNTGTVSGSSYVGGVCGYNNFGTIIGSYSIGTVIGSGSNVGGVCGYNSSYSTMTRCYTNSDVVCGGGSGTVKYCDIKTDAEFTNGTVCGLLNTALQNVNPDIHYYQGTNYPELIVIPNLPKLVAGVYQISNEKELYAFAQLVNSGAEPSANAVLTADITVNENVLNNLNSGTFTDWTPIGNSSNKYTGKFNGQNYTISGLYFNNTSAGTSNVGLFGYLGENGEIKNVGVIDSYIRGYSSVGGICGENNSGTITGCYNTGAVSSRYNYAGGVCGMNRNTMTECYNTGTVSGRSRVGGVSGWNGNSGTIIGCYNIGAVSSTNGYVGGVCGYNYTTITGCHNTGTVSGSSYAGGVCGYSTSTGTIANCYYDSDKYSGNAVGVSDGTVTDAEGKTTAQFASGEVAYLLSQGENGSVWGQEIGTEDYPVLNGKKVLTNVDCSAFANDIIVYGQSASLDGTIGFNIYVSADDSYEWDKTVNGVQGVEIENGLYKFTYQVAAKDMDEKINFTVNDKIDVTVSVSDYLAVLSETDNESLKNLADYMSNYGDAAKAYFGGEAVAEQTVTDDLSVYDFTVGTMPEGISYYGSSLILDSETTIRHYFKLAEGKEIGEYTFSVDGTTVTPTEKQGYYCIDIKNVRADKLGTSFSVSVNGEEVITNYSALSYVYKALDSDSTDDNLKNLVKALYIYNRNALAYINEA